MGGRKWERTMRTSIKSFYSNKESVRKDFEQVAHFKYDELLEAYEKFREANEEIFPVDNSQKDNNSGKQLMKKYEADAVCAVISEMVDRSIRLQQQIYEKKEGRPRYGY